MGIFEELGASEAVATQKFSIYIPNKDRNHQILPDWSTWIDSAIYLLAEINGGSTSLPASKSAWKGEDDRMMSEEAVVVYSFIRHPDEFEKNLGTIKAFIRDFGIRADQESVLVELADCEACFINRDDFS
ncbi:MAG TPA: hypothetical protein VMG08_07020 [Allosphingosinicella sp.]|nr:hypothetical protein [Allosphingosinicella sp.]